MFAIIYTNHQLYLARSLRYARRATIERYLLAAG
jgi:hypothetical protein